MKNVRRGAKVTAFAVAGALALSACAADSDGGSESVDQVLIGGTYPLTGVLADDGQEMVDAIELAFADVNASGGIESLGAEAVFRVLDSTGAPEQAAQNVQSLIDDGAVSIIGAWLSSNTLATTQIAERAGIPHIVDQSQAPELIERGFENTFRVMFDPPKVAVSANDFIEVANAELGLDGTAVHLFEESAFGSAQNEYFVAEAERRGNLDVLLSIPYASTTTDLSAEVAQAIASGADMLLSTGYSADSLLLLNTLEEQGADFGAIIAVDSAGWYTNRFADRAGELVEGVFDSGTYPIDFESEEYISFAERFEAEYGIEPSGGAVMSYVSARVLLEAIDRAGSADPADIREMLATGTFDSYLLHQDELSFDEFGQNEQIVPVSYQFQNLRREVVFPYEVATAEPRW